LSEGETIVTAPYATLLGFTRYVGRTGPEKAIFVGGLRRQREAKSGFNPHGPLIKALKADIQFRTGGAYLAAVTESVKPRWRPLYEVLTAGALRYLSSLDERPGSQLVRTRDAIGIIGGLTVRINPHFGIRTEAGDTEAIRLCFEENPPSDEVLVATSHLMARHMDQILPEAVPVLVDVRRGTVLRPVSAPKPAEVERWLAGEAVGFAAMWTTAA
jgi:hypothetical protein